MLQAMLSINLLIIESLTPLYRRKIPEERLGKYSIMNLWNIIYMIGRKIHGTSNRIVQAIVQIVRRVSSQKTSTVHTSYTTINGYQTVPSAIWCSFHSLPHIQQAVNATLYLTHSLTATNTSLSYGIPHNLTSLFPTQLITTNILHRIQYDLTTIVYPTQDGLIPFLFHTI